MILNLFMKYFILMIMLMLSFFSLFMNDLIFIWMMMEINNFLFISLLCITMNNKKMIFFYYLIQIIPSMMLILSISINNIMLINNKIFLIIMYLSLMIKLGIPPFHYWMISMSIYMNWNNLFFMLSIQKIIPFYFLLNIKLNKMFLNLFLILTSLIPPIMMFNLTNFKQFMSYSSINQLSWMILLLYIKPLIWTIYMFIYTLMMFILFKMFNYYKLFYNYINMKKNNLMFNMLFMFMMMNLMGIPPFSLFFMKWLSLFILIFNSNLIFISILMIFSSFLMLFMYLNMIYLFMFNNLINFKMIYFNNNLIYNYLFMIKMMLIMFISIFLLII